MVEDSTDPTGDHAFVDVVDGAAEAPETPMRHLPRRVRWIFLGVLSLIAALLYGVGAFGLAPDSAKWPGPVAWIMRAVLAASALTMVLLVIRSNTDRGTDRQSRIAHVLLGVGWMLFTTTLVTDLALRLPLWVGGVPNPLRSRVVAVVLLILVALAVTLGAREALRVPRVRRVQVPIRALPAPLAGSTIAILTDTHFDAWTTRRWGDAVVARLNLLEPDLVVHAGDLADGSVTERGPQVAALAGVTCPHRYYIAGNHEYYSGVDDWLGEMSAHGWQVLLNTHAIHRTGAREADSALVIAGVDDPTGTGRGRGPDLDAALDGAPDGLPIVLLAHQPHLIRQARDRVDLQISGHTHGGQIWPFHYIVRLREPVVQGLSHHGARTRLYTSRGTGFWGPPFRLFAPSEISLLTLTAAD